MRQCGDAQHLYGERIQLITACCTSASVWVVLLDMLKVSLGLVSSEYIAVDEPSSYSNYGDLMSLISCILMTNWVSIIRETIDLS